MKKYYFIFIFAVIGLFMTECNRSCDDRYLSLTVRNESSDTVYWASCFADIFPPEEHFFKLMPPGAEDVSEFWKNDLENYGWTDYIVRKKIVDQYGWKKLINERMYDTIFTWRSFAELDARKFIVKIKTEHFKNQADF